MHYIFHANDSAANWNETPQKDVIISDNDRPVFGMDSTPSSGTTGDSLAFLIVVTDNIDIHTITVEYWFGYWFGKVIHNTTMFGPGPYSLTISIPSESTSTLHYIFHVNDSANNWNETPQKDVIISDNDRPVFGMDSTPSSGTTGDSLAFLIVVTDNIDIHTITVEYWFGYWFGKVIHNTTMFGPGPYSLTISIPSDSIDTLHYIFHARDSAGNWNETLQKDANILDIKNPIFRTDSTPTSGTTGDEFGFGVEVTDNIGIGEVWIEYWLGKGYHYNETMNAGDRFTFFIILPADSILELHYIFHACDTSGNWATTLQKDVVIIDNDLPFLENDGSDQFGTTGDEFDFKFEGTDNIGIGEVWIEYWFGSGTYMNLSLDGEGPFNLSIIIPFDSLHDLNYIFHFKDTFGNWNETAVVNILMFLHKSP